MYPGCAASGASRVCHAQSPAFHLAIYEVQWCTYIAKGVDIMANTIKLALVNPIGRNNLQFRRRTNRYGKVGTFSNNQGYLSVSRDVMTGKFLPRPRQLKTEWVQV